MTDRKPTGNKWLTDRKEVFVRNAVWDFLKACRFFTQIQQSGQEGKDVTFSDLDCWVGTEVRKGPLWHLKELCHAVWGDENQMDLECAFFDWLIGSIFHEAMKLKENAYILQYYKPAYEKMMAQRGDAEPNGYREDYLELFKQTTEEVKMALARLDRLFLKAREQLHTILLKCNDNYLVIRLLMENESEFDRVWGPDSIPRLFGQMFSGRGEKGYCLAAQSYQEGDWLENALDAYQKALKINPDSEEARRGRQAVKGLLEKQRLQSPGTPSAS